MSTRRLLAIPVAVLALTLLGASDIGIDQGEFVCEEAVKHLLDCCPDDTNLRQLRCYTSRYCGSSLPDLPLSEAECLRDESCDSLYASGACEHPKTTRVCGAS